MRPQSIIMFERLFLASLAVSTISFFVSYDAVAGALAADPGMAQLGLGTGFVVGIFIVGLALYLLLWFLVARKAVNWAKWVLVAFLALSLVSLPAALAGPWNLTMLLGLVTYALELAAVVYLFRADAKAWLSGNDTVDPATFD